MAELLNIEALLHQLEYGTEIDAFEAAKKLETTKNSNLIDQLARILRSASQPHSRKAAAYTLGWLKQRDAAGPLLECAGDDNEVDSVRGQAIESLAICFSETDAATDHWTKAEDLMIGLLKSSSVEVRFWSCYGLGALQCKRAIPMLREVEEKDESVYPGWWYIREEAHNAIECIEGRPWVDLIPLSSREKMGGKD